MLKGHGNSHEIIGFEGGSAYKATIYIGACKELLGVGGFAATTVEDADVISYLFAVFGGEEGAYMSMYFLRLVGSGGFPCSDGPDGFVSYDYFS